MIVYQATKDKFSNDIFDGNIVEILKTKLHRKVDTSEISSWENSLSAMDNLLLRTPSIPGDAGIAIEYGVPGTSKRVDFIITGLDDEMVSQAVIIELKQWNSVKVVDDKDAVVCTALGRAMRETTHPSYQAWSYAFMLRNFASNIRKYSVKLSPCAYLHNYRVEDDDPLLDSKYSQWVKEAPVFAGNKKAELQKFLERRIRKGDHRNIIAMIDSSPLIPSKSLQDSIVNLIKGNNEFVMIDDQMVCYSTLKHLAMSTWKNRNTDPTPKKQVVIVRGGPGTGKSVIAVNLLVALTSNDLHPSKLNGMPCKYVTKNLAPREVYKTLLYKDKTRKHIDIDFLFSGSGRFYTVEKNTYACLIVDEAHRLMEKGDRYSKGENQIKEIINATWTSVFFIDPKQRVTSMDFGSVEEIKKQALLAKANITEMELKSQFRCSGSDDYLTWVDEVLQLENTHYGAIKKDEYDVEVFDDPNVMFDLIKEKNKVNNKSRMVAGYCWVWDSKHKHDPDYPDIVIENENFEFKASWNLDNTSTYAIDDTSVNEVGCIHTVQGLEFDYVGVIIGDDLKFENGKVVTNVWARAKSDSTLNGLKTKAKKKDPFALRETDAIIRNTYRTLMTRGQLGCYIYCQNKALAQYIKSMIAD